MAEFKELSPETWKDYETLMGEKGGCGGCWCMTWRVPRSEWDARKGEPNRRAMKKLVAEGRARGVLAYEDGEPVAWCSFGPKQDYTRLAKTKSYVTADAEGVWSVTCFFVRKDKRGRGLAAKVLDEAARAARKLGARVLEGYPATKTKAGAKLPAAFVWTGPEPIFKRCGFEEMQRLAWSRPVYRKRLATRRR